MKNKGMSWTLVFVALLVIVPGFTWAIGGPQGDVHKGPPPEAIEACRVKGEGTAVEITTPRGDTIKATCKQIDGQMVAVPAVGYRGPKGTPPGGMQKGNN
jgi:hypothetical protein